MAKEWRTQGEGIIEAISIDEAVKILDLSMDYADYHDLTKLEDAMKLGKEALLRIQILRQEKLFDGAVSLPGETKE